MSPGAESVVSAEAVSLAVRVGIALPPVGRRIRQGVVEALQVGETEVGGVIVVVGDLGRISQKLQFYIFTLLHFYTSTLLHLYISTFLHFYIFTALAKLSTSKPPSLTSSRANYTKLT